MEERSFEGHYNTADDQGWLIKEIWQNSQQIWLRRGKGGVKMTHALNLIHKENNNIINKKGQEEKKFGN